MKLWHSDLSYNLGLTSISKWVGTKTHCKLLKWSKALSSRIKLNSSIFKCQHVYLFYFEDFMLKIVKYSKISKNILYFHSQFCFLKIFFWGENFNISENNIISVEPAIVLPYNSGTKERR